jgi:anti-sigma B factor antagonist
MHGFARNIRRATSGGAQHAYRIETYTTAPGDYVLALDGELDLAARPDLERELSRLQGFHPRSVVADLTGATFVDTGTLGLLARAEVRLVCNDRHTLKILRLTGLDRALEIFETLAQAVGQRAYPENVVVLRRTAFG